MYPKADTVRTQIQGFPIKSCGLELDSQEDGKAGQVKLSISLGTQWLCWNSVWKGLPSSQQQQ